MPATLDVSNALRNPGRVYALDQQLEIEDMDVLGDPVHFENVTANGEFFGTGETVSLKGTITATVHSRCARCLEPVSEPITARLDALYTRQADPDDPDLYLFAGSRVDLTDAVREALLLELPYRFLCKEDCKGLCPTCGANLNLGVCTCQKDATDANPFAALKAIVQNYEEV